MNKVTNIVCFHWEYDNKECGKENSGWILDKYIFINTVRHLYKLHASVADFVQTGAFTNGLDESSCR